MSKIKRLRIRNTVVVILQCNGRYKYRLSFLRDVDALCELVDVLERTLDTIENVSHDAGPELHGERLAGTQHGVPNRYTAGLLVHLHYDPLKCAFCLGVLVRLLVLIRLGI